MPADALCILTDALGITPSPDTLLGLAISAHKFTRRWQYARGLPLQPDASNMLERLRLAC
jgi:hypothetical protein